MLISTNNQEKINVTGTMINYEKVGTGWHPILCLPGALGELFLPLYVSWSWCISNVNPIPSPDLTNGAFKFQAPLTPIFVHNSPV
jgi:hypothetical protein